MMRRKAVKVKRKLKGRQTSSKKTRRSITAHPTSGRPDNKPTKPLPLPWPRKNSRILKKARITAVTRCWTFLDSVQDDCKLVFDCGAQIKARSLRRIKPGMMLNDEVMNASFKYLGWKVKRQGRKVKIFNSYFFTTLHGHGNYSSTNYNFQATKRWTKPSRLPAECQTVFDLDLMVFPIFLKVRRHWLCGVIINRSTPKFCIFNSDIMHRGYATEHRRIVKSMKRWWTDERATRAKEIGPLLKAVVVNNIPQQGVDSNDCGPISYAYAKLACLLSPEVSRWPRFLKGLWLRDMMLCDILRNSKQFRNYRNSENI